MTEGPTAMSLFDEARLVIQVPLFRDRPIRFFHPLLARHTHELDTEVRLMWASGEVRTYVIAERESLLHVYVMPVHGEVGMMLAWDLTPALLLAARQKESLVQVYKDMLHATTNGKMHLVEPEELSDIVRGQLWSHELHVQSVTDIELCRSLAMHQLQKAKLPSKWVVEFVLAVSEAVTNALKHTTGGVFQLTRTSDGWIALMRDYGRGIDYSILPYATILRGYSTKLSLGLGFDAMLRCVDRIYLCTTDEGVTVLLLKSDPGLNGPQPA